MGDVSGWVEVNNSLTYRFVLQKRNKERRLKDKRKRESKEGRKYARRREGIGVWNQRRKKVVKKDDVDGYHRVGLGRDEKEEENGCKDRR